MGKGKLRRPQHSPWGGDPLETSSLSLAVADQKHRFGAEGEVETSAEKETLVFA